MADTAPLSKRSRPATQHDAFPLRTVAALTGLSTDLIRAWEKRYGVVRPVRGARGARLYSRQDIEYLHLLARAVAEGRSIGDVAGMDRDALSSMVDARSDVPATPVTADLVEEIVVALTRFDTEAVQRKLGEALVASGGRRFVLELAVPLLHEIGTRWRGGALSMASEHLLSGIMRNLLTNLIHARGRATRPLVLLATPSGERHELGLLLVAFMVLDGGAGVLYLGPDLPGAEIATAARSSGASVVGIGVVGEENHARAVEEMRIIHDGIPAHTHLWLGGMDAPAIAADLSPFSGVVLSDLGEVETEVARLRRNPLREVGREA